MRGENRRDRETTALTHLHLTDAGGKGSGRQAVLKEVQAPAAGPCKRICRRYKEFCTDILVRQAIKPHTRCLAPPGISRAPLWRLWAAQRRGCLGPARELAVQLARPRAHEGTRTFCYKSAGELKQT